MLLSYARVSTARQGEDHKFSLPDQLRKNYAVAMMRNVDKFDVAEYIDNGVSGGKQFTKRPAGGRLWLEMKPGDIVVATKLDRMFRSASDALVMLERFREHKVGVILLDIGTEPIGQTPMSEAFFGLIAIFANLERRMINDRTANGKEGKRQKGGYIGAGVPYGWRVEGEGKDAMLLPHEDEQKIVEYVCQAREMKSKWHVIVDELRDSGARTREGKPFQFIQVARMHSYEMQRRARLKEAA